MTHLVPVGFLDVSVFTAAFISKHRSSMKSDVLELRSAKGDLPVVREWKSAQSLFKRLRNEAGRFMGKPAELGAASIDVLGPDQRRNWKIAEDEYAQAHISLAVCLVPSPGAWFYCGGEAMVLPVGQVTLINRMAWHAEANFGPCARVNLLIDLKRPEPD